MGAGAVGCYYGGLLARAGNEVCVIGRAQHTDALKQRGLMLEVAGKVDLVPVEATTQADDIRGAEMVLCCGADWNFSPYGFLGSFGIRRFPKGERKALWCARRRLSFVSMED